MKIRLKSRNKRTSIVFGTLIIVFIIALSVSFFKDKLSWIVIDSQINADTGYVSADSEDEIENNLANEEKENEEKNDDIKENENLLIDTVYVDNDGNSIIKNPDDILVLVNKERNLPSDYSPTDLVIPNVNFSFNGESEKKYLREEAAKALEQLFSQAEEEGIILYAVSGYRSYKKQESIFRNKVNKVGVEEANKVVARPGQSEHQTGLAMDVSSRSAGFSLEKSFGQTVEGQWLKENAHKFGFIIRYPKGKEDITGYSYEPWHIRYVGKELAAEIYDKGITLEEYFGFEYSK